MNDSDFISRVKEIQSMDNIGSHKRLFLIKNAISRNCYYNFYVRRGIDPSSKSYDPALARKCEEYTSHEIRKYLDSIRNY